MQERNERYNQAETADSLVIEGRNAVLEALISCAEKSQTGNCNVIVGEEK